MYYYITMFVKYELKRENTITLHQFAAVWEEGRFCNFLDELNLSSTFLKKQTLFD